MPCPAIAAAQDATLESVTYSRTMQGGKSYPVSITFKNTGTVTWTTGSPESRTLFRLGADEDSVNWGLNRVEMAAAAVPPGASHTFNFMVTAPLNTSGRYSRLSFPWQMLNERERRFGEATPTHSEQLVEIAHAPNILNSARWPLISPAASVVLAPRAQFNFANFRGANIVNKRYMANWDTQYGSYSHSAWFHDDADTRLLLDAAQRMNLNVLRIPVVIPPTASSGAYNYREWAGATSEGALADVIRKTRFLMDEAASRGIKVIVTLDGYTKYGYPDESDKKCYWKNAYTDIEANARALIQAVAHHPALFAWDLLNEPLHNAAVVGFINWSSHESVPKIRGTTSCLENRSGVADVSAYKSVVNAVHAMYNLVRANDPLNHYTTVSEGHVAYMNYFSDISSFYSFHQYYNIDLNGAHVAAKPLVLKSTMKGNLDALRNQPIHSSRPIVITEFGYESRLAKSDLPAVVETKLAAQRNWYYHYLSNMKSMNIGGALWSLSTFNEYSIAPGGARLECVIKNAQMTPPPSC